MVTLRFALLLLGAVLLSETSGAGTKDGILDRAKFERLVRGHVGSVGLANPRHPGARDRENWLRSREGIRKAFHNAGIPTEQQCFNTTIMTQEGQLKTVTGCNIIGVAEGESDKERIIVGANYDTSTTTDYNHPLYQNGMGVALLLEIAMAFRFSVNWKNWKQKYTTIFVAFDLNTMEEESQTSAHPGSHFFVEEWLRPSLKYNPVKGVFLLESVGLLNTVKLSQVIVDDMKAIFPEAHASIKENERRGDFLAAITTGAGTDLVTTLAGHYNRDKDAHPSFRLQEMVAGSAGFGGGSTREMLQGFDARAFWFRIDPIPTVLLTDTGHMPGGYRVLPQSDSCGMSCDFFSEERLDFLYKTYTSLSHTLLNLQAVYDPPNDGGSSIQSSVAATAMCMLALFLFRSP